MRESWTDERLDDLNRHIDDGFRRVRGEFREVRTEMQAMRSEADGRLDLLDSRLDGIQRTMVYGAVGLTAAILAGFSAIIALIATRL